MKCPYCNYELQKGSKFCDNCGQEIRGVTGNSQVSNNYWEDYQAKTNEDVSQYRAKLQKEKEKKKKKRRTAIGIWLAFGIIGVIICYFVIIYPNQQYNKALSLMAEGKYADAYVIFEGLEDYRNSEEELVRCNDALTQIKYENAVSLFESGDLEIAMAEFHDLGTYSDSEYYYGICEIDAISKAQERDVVTFGKFEGEDINWIVLDKTGDKVLLITESYIANMQFDAEYHRDEYNERWIYHCWSNSSLRGWLNGEFINTFTASELERICESDLATYEFETENYDGWNEEEIIVNTIDRIFVPTIDDVYAYTLYTNSVVGKQGWLRDRGHGMGHDYTLDTDGDIHPQWGNYEAWVRPMMYISLEGLEIVEHETVEDCYNEKTPFSGKYWVIFRNGRQDERIEATSIDSTHDPNMLHVVWEDYELDLNDTNGSDNWTQYVLSDDGEWIEDSHHWRIADKTKTIIASNLDVYDEEGKIIVNKSCYSDIDWANIG